MRPTAHLFLGDAHAGSKLAPLLPFTDADGVNYAPSRVQSLLLDYWRQAFLDAKEAARGHRVVLHLGGDLVDGVAHHGSTQTVLDYNGQRDLAVELLRPWVNLAEVHYGLLGTDAHVGDNGQADTSVCKELGVPTAGHWRIESGGKVIDWAHHIGGSRKAWLKENAGVTLANKTWAECLDRVEPVRAPDLIVRHHMHQYMHTLAHRIQVVTVPGWQTQTSFARRLDPNGLLTVGLVAWFPERGEVRPLLYDMPATQTVRVSFARQTKKRKPITR